MGVLPEGEAAPLHVHLAACSACGEEFAEMMRVTALLPFAAEDAAPDPEVRSGLMLRIGREPVALPARGPSSLPRRWLLPAAAGIALIVGVGALAGFLAGAAADDSHTDPRPARVVEAAANGTLRSTHIEQDGLRATFVRAPGERHGFVWVEGMPQLPPGKAYQAWFTRDGRVFEPSTVFLKATGGVWLPAQGDISGYALIGFTVEDRDGASRPSQEPFAVLDLNRAARIP